MDAFRRNEETPLEGVIASHAVAAPAVPAAPVQRIMTIFELDDAKEGLVFFSHPGAKVDEMKANPNVSMTFWLPRLGAMSTVVGRVEVGDVVPAPKVKPGEKAPCPCIVPSGHRCVVVIDNLSITRMDAKGDFKTESFFRGPNPGEWV